MNIKKSLISFILLFLALAKVIEANEVTLYQMPGTQVIPIKDTQSDKQYELYIKLPEDYSKDKDKKYPVIYFTDAVWHIELLSAATAFIMEEVILVGVSWQTNIEESVRQEYGSHFSRFGDYSFWEKPNPKHPKIKFGQANKHLTFIRKDVIKYIENNYRTRPKSRSYFGYSAGGLFGAYTMLTQPDTFQNYILGSPSVQFLTESDTKVEFNNKKINANVFITHGDKEKELSAHIKTFLNFLDESGNDNLSIKHLEIKGDHQSAFPMTGIRSVTWLSELNIDESSNDQVN